MMKLIKNKIMQRRAPHVLILINGDQYNQSYVGKMRFKLCMATAHISKLVKKFEDAELLTREKVGRIKVLKLTPLGEDIQKHLIEINRILERCENE